MSIKKAWGLDIGHTGLRAVQLTRNNDNTAQITDTYFQPLDMSTDNEEHNNRVLKDELEEFIQQKQIDTTPFVVSLSGYSILFRNFYLPQVGDAKLSEIVKYEAKQLIPYPLEEVMWDYHQSPALDGSGEIEISLVCCRKDIVEKLLNVLDESNINVKSLQAGPLGLVNYMFYDSPMSQPTLILDVGAHNTDYIMTNKQSLWFRSIGVSGNDITKVLAEKFSLSNKDAESLKTTLTDDKQTERVFNTVQPVLRNLCGEVCRSIGYYKNLNRGAEIKRIIGAGRTFLMPGVDQFMADNVRLEVELIGEPATLTASSELDKLQLKSYSQVLGVASGLALQGVGLAEVNTDLFPKERRAGLWNSLKTAIAKHVTNSQETKGKIIEKLDVRVGRSVKFPGKIIEEVRTESPTEKKVSVDVSTKNAYDFMCDKYRILITDRDELIKKTKELQQLLLENISTAENRIMLGVYFSKLNQPELALRQFENVRSMFNMPRQINDYLFSCYEQGLIYEKTAIKSRSLRSANKSLNAFLKVFEIDVSFGEVESKIDKMKKFVKELGS